jgi:hypothetical protein
VHSMQAHSIDDVRNLINYLMNQEYDFREPIQLKEYQILQNREICLQIIIKLHQTQELIHSSLTGIDEKIYNVLEGIQFMQNSLIPCLSLIPFKGNKTGADLINDFQSLFVLLKDTRTELQERHVRGFDEMEAHNIAIDSDEEERLFEELDQLMEAQERMEAFKGNAHKFMANSVQKAFRGIEDLENAFRLVSCFIQPPALKNGFSCGSLNVLYSNFASDRFVRRSMVILSISLTTKNQAFRA